jgi:MoxR-like ATPase
MTKVKKVSNLPKCWQTLENALLAGIDRVVLYGAPGIGKTYAGLNLGNVEGGAHRLACTDDMTTAEVTGMWTPTKEGNLSWNEGAGILAWRGNGIVGGRLVIDEIDKAGGDVFASLLAITDSPESSKWTNPETHETVVPLDGFSVVMTTNIEQMEELPIALKDRFPVCIRINEPHPNALVRLSADLREPARAMCDAGERRISLRSWYAFDKLRSALDAKTAAEMVFHSRAKSILDALKVEAGK